MDISARIGRSDPWWLGCVALAAVAVGLLAGVKPEYGLLAAGGMAFAVIVIMDLTLGFVLFTGLSFLDVLNGSSSFTGTKVVGLLLFVSWVARIATRQRADMRSFVAENPALVFALIAMLGWCALSFAWATSPSTALGGTGRYALDMMLVPIAFMAMRERQHVVWVISAFVVGAVVSSMYGFLHPVAATSGDAGRLTGLNGDANGEATVLAAAIPLLIGLIGVVRHSARFKLAALVGVIILFGGLVDTLSREGLLSLAAVMVVAVIFGGRWRGLAAVLLVVGVTATAGYYFVLAPLASRQRVTMSDTSGRSSIWTVAWRVIKAHPVLGVGNDNFILVEGRYINRPGAIQANFIVVAPKLTHNTFLEALADLGIPGLLTLVAVLGCAIGAAVRAARIFERCGDSRMELISRTVVLALVAVLTSDLFVASGYAKYLWILLAICPALLSLARRAEVTASDQELGTAARV
jgi:putative inorganic carbon (HCO3(-)) transporter